jgi:hypothetical protein
MKMLVALVVGVALGGAGLAVAAGVPSWRHDGVFCWASGTKGVDRGVACRLEGSKRLVIVNQRSIIVAQNRRVIFVTPSK